MFFFFPKGLPPQPRIDGGLEALAKVNYLPQNVNISAMVVLSLKDISFCFIGCLGGGGRWKRGHLRGP